LLDYARPGPLVLGKVSLFKLVRETLNFVEHQPMFRNLTLTNRVPLDLPPLTADVNHLSQILMNLLLNAAQATPAGGSIIIAAELERTAGVVELRVTDSGSGIPADILPHIFEPFFTTKSEAKVLDWASVSVKTTFAAMAATSRSRAWRDLAPQFE
jgi:signal transduction histidine kinase